MSLSALPFTLALFDQRGRAALIRTQINSIGRCARYLRTLSPPDKDLLAAIEKASCQLDKRIVNRLDWYISTARQEAINAQDRSNGEMLAALESLLNNMVNAQAELHNLIPQVRILTQSLGQAYQAMAPEQPRAGFHWGADQQSASKAMMLYAEDSKAVLMNLFRNRLGCSELDSDTSNSPLVVAHEIDAYPEQFSILQRPVKDGPVIILGFLLSTRWQAYMPRYFPNETHEIAHPFVEYWMQQIISGALGTHLQKRFEELESQISNIVTRRLGPITQYLCGFHKMICIELLVDMAALWCAGPSYLVSLSASMIASSPLRETQRISVPLGVRLRMLIRAANKLKPRDSGWENDIIDFVDCAQNTHRQILIQKFGVEPAKFQYQNELLDVANNLCDLFFEETRIAKFATEDSAVHTSINNGQSEQRAKQLAQDMRTFFEDLPSTSPPSSDWLKVHSDDLPGLSPENELARPLVLPNILWTLAVRNASAITSRFLNKMNRETGEMYSTPTVFPELRMTYRWQSFCECLSSPKCLQPRPEQDISVLKWGGCYQLTFFDFVFGNSRDEEGCPPQIEQVQKQLLKAVSEVCQKEDATGLLGFLLGSWDAAAITPGIGWREPDRWKELLDSVTCTVDKHSLHALQSYGDKYTLRLDALSKHDQPNRPLVFSQFRLHSRSCDVRAFVEDITSLVNSEQKLRDEVSIIGIFASVGWEDFLVVFRLDGGLSSFLALHKHLLARATSGLPYLRTLSYPLVSAWMAEGQDLATKPLYNDRQLHIGDIKPGWQLQLTTRVRVSEARYIYEIFDKTTAFQKKHESLCNGTVFEPILVFGEHDLIVRTRLNENGEFAAFWKLIDELIKDEHTLSCESSVSLVQTAIKEWIL